MKETKVNITNASPKIAVIVLLLICMNTCLTMTYQERASRTQKQQLEQAKKQYTLDSLQYENTLRFQEEYMKQNHRLDSIMSVLNKNTSGLTGAIKQRTKHNQEVFNHLKANEKKYSR